jgi:DNA-binding beta-propeller fold protein YncE
VVSLSRWIVSITLASFQGVSGDAPLRLVGTIELPAIQGRIDHLAVDLAHARLFVAALGNNTVEVIDLRDRRVVQSLQGFDEPQGVAVAPDLNMLVVANGGNGRVQLLNGADLHSGKTVPLSGDADNVRYDPRQRRVYVGYGSGALAAIDPLSGSRIADIRLGGHPESLQLERNGDRIFVNVPGAGHIAVVDRKDMHLVSTWAMAGARANYPMALNEAAHRLFVGCRHPSKALVFDTSSGRIVASFDITGDTDDLFFDEVRQRVYVSGGEGFLDVIQQQPGDHFMRVLHLSTASGARTSLYVAEQNRLYLAVPRRGSTAAQIRIYEMQ